MELSVLTLCLSGKTSVPTLELGTGTGACFSCSDILALWVVHWGRTVALVFLACFSWHGTLWMSWGEGLHILDLPGIEILQPEAGAWEWEVLAACFSREETIALDWELGEWKPFLATFTWNRDSVTLIDLFWVIETISIIVNTSKGVNGHWRERVVEKQEGLM